MAQDLQPLFGPQKLQDLRLDEPDIYLFEQMDLRKRRIVGASPMGVKFDMNIIECAIEGATFNCANMARVDVKDCKIDGCIYIECDLSEASVASNVYSSVRFNLCKFKDTAISGCHFVNCTFIDCDLKSVVIKDCRFTACHFVGCDTNTKTIEGSLLLECAFDAMPLPIDIVIENFGLKRDQCTDITLKGRQIKGRGQPEIALADLMQMAELEELTTMQKLGLSFFLNNEIDVFSPTFLEAIDIRKWGDIAAAPASICAAVDKLTDFIIYQYKVGKIPMYGILALHMTTSDIFELPPEKVGEFVFPIYSAHVKLSHVVEEFLVALSGWGEIILERPKPLLEFGANGPLSIAHFQEFLESVGFKTGLSVQEVRPRNSPVFLSILAENKEFAVALISLFLASRIEVEIRHATQKAPAKERDSVDAKFGIVIGMAAAKNARQALAMRALLPSGWAAEFKVAFSTTYVKKARAVLVELIGVK